MAAVSDTKTMVDAQGNARSETLIQGKDSAGNQRVEKVDVIRAVDGQGHMAQGMGFATALIHCR